MNAWTIRAGSTEDVDALRGLWLGIHHQHQQVAPNLAPYVNDARSWEIRRAFYAGILESGMGTLLVALIDDHAVGYAMANTIDAADSWIADTWSTGDHIAEIESLSVDPALRGTGLGSQLLEGLERLLADRGVKDVVIGALPGNSGAVRLYERRGYRPTWLYLSKFAGDVGQPPGATSTNGTD